MIKPNAWPLAATPRPSDWWQCTSGAGVGSRAGWAGSSPLHTGPRCPWKINKKPRLLSVRLILLLRSLTSDGKIQRRLQMGWCPRKLCSLAAARVLGFPPVAVESLTLSYWRHLVRAGARPEYHLGSKSSGRVSGTISALSCLHPAHRGQHLAMQCWKQNCLYFLSTP